MSIKQENEITVRLKCSIEELVSQIEKKNFKLTKEFKLDDTYFIPKEMELEKLTYREILSKAIVIRDIEYFKDNFNIKLLTYKEKNIDESGNIVNQKKYEVEIKNIEEAVKFLQVIGYKKIMNIYELDKIYKKGEISFAIKDIKNGDKLIEMETVEDNNEMDTIDKLKEKINNLDIPIYTDNYFVKKAEIELDKVLKRKE